MRRSSAAGTLVFAALAWLLLLPAAVAAFPLENCTMSLQSFGANGAPLDTAQSGDASASQADPFQVDYEGTVRWSGTVSISMVNNSYFINVMNIPTPLRGSNSNEGDNRTGGDTVSVAANSPFRVTGTYLVSGAITGSGGTCSGSGWFKLLGDPVGTVPFFAGAALLALGAVLLALGIRGNELLAALGGLLAGAGAAVEFVIFSVLPAGENTVIVVVLVGLASGVVIALVGRSLAAGKPDLSNPDVGITG
jgi:hypothetical protein